MVTLLIRTFPIGYLQATSNIPNLSFGLTFQLLITTSSSQPSGINPSKNENNILDVYSFFVSGSVKLTAEAFLEFLWQGTMKKMPYKNGGNAYFALC